MESNSLPGARRRKAKAGPTDCAVTAGIVDESAGRVPVEDGKRVEILPFAADTSFWCGGAHVWEHSVRRGFFDREDQRIHQCRHERAGDSYLHNHGDTLELEERLHRAEGVDGRGQMLRQFVFRLCAREVARNNAGTSGVNYPGPDYHPQPAPANAS